MQKKGAISDRSKAYVGRVGERVLGFVDGILAIGFDDLSDL